MAGAMRKAMVYLGLVEDEDRYDYDDYDEAGTPSGGEGREPRAGRVASGSTRAPVSAVRDSTRGGVATMTERRPQVTVQGEDARAFDRITTIHPRTYNEAKTIGLQFRAGTPVIMNLSEMDDSDAKRLVDFSAGLVFAVHGTIERVTSKVFLLSPPNVSVAAEDKQRIAEGGFFNQS